MTHRALEERLERLCHRVPPYLAAFMNAYLAAGDGDPIRALHIGDTVVRHIAALCYSAMTPGEIEARLKNPGLGPYKTREQLVLEGAAWLVSNWVPNSRAEKVLFGVSAGTLAAALASFVQDRAALVQARAGASSRQVASLIGLLDCTEALLARPIQVAKTFERDRDSETKLNLLRFQGPTPRPRGIRVNKGDHQPCTKRCFVVIEGSRSGEGWLIDLHPWIAWFSDENGEHVGLAAPDSTDRDPVYTYDGSARRVSKIEGTADEAEHPGAVKVGDGWFHLDHQIDPHVKREAESLGFTFPPKDALLGTGSFGTVYKVLHGNPPQAYALKVLHGGFALKDDEARRTKREIDRMSTCDSRHVVRYERFDGAVHLDKPPYWFTMELVPGPPRDQGTDGEADRAPNLAEWCAQAGVRTSLEHREQMALSLVRGVASLHHRGIVHRDVRPENVLIRATATGPEPVIVDLGLARMPASAESTRAAGTVAQLGLGAAPFAPPEQRLARSLSECRDPKVDVHALGWTIAWLLHAGEPLRGLADLEAHRWTAVLRQCVDENTSSRPTDASDLLHQLERTGQFGDTASAFRVGCTLADGSFALGPSPFSSKDWLETVPPEPMSHLRGWTVRVTGSCVDWDRINAVHHELAASVVVSPLLSWAVDGDSAIFTVPALRWAMPLSEWAASMDRGVRPLGTLLAGLLRTARALATRRGIGLRSEHVLVDPDGVPHVALLVPGRLSDGHGVVDRVEALLRAGPREEATTASGAAPSDSGYSRSTGWRDTRDMNAVFALGLRTLRQVASALTGRGAAWLDDDSAALHALEMSLIPALDDWSDAVNLEDGHIERLREEHREREDAEQRKYKEGQDRKRALWEEGEAERHRVYDEQYQLRLAEWQEQVAKWEKEVAEWEKRESGEPPPQKPERPQYQFTENPYPKEQFPDHPFVPPDVLRSTLVLTFDPNHLDVILPPPRPIRPPVSILDQVRAALQDVGQGGAFGLHDRVVLADAVAWLIALLAFQGSEAELEGRLRSEAFGALRDALMTAAEDKPWWGPRAQLLHMLTAAPSSTHPSMLVAPAHRTALRTVVEEVNERLDHRGMPIRPEDDPSDLEQRYLRALVACLEPLHLPGDPVLDDRGRIGMEDEPRLVAVRRADDGEVERELAAPFFKMSDGGGLAWIQGVRLETDGKLSVCMGAVSGAFWEPVTATRRAIDVALKPDEQPLPRAAPATPAVGDGSVGEEGTKEEHTVDIAILTAIEVERRAVCQALGLDKKHKCKKNDRWYWRGELLLENGSSYDVVVAQPPDQGQVDIANLTKDVLSDWQPRAALLVGIAGSADPEKVRLGDVVVGKSVWYYEPGKVTPSGTKPQPAMSDADAGLLKHYTGLESWDGKVPVERPDGVGTMPAVHRGVIASGEKVIADPAVRDQLLTEQREIMAIAMEDYGFSRSIWQSSPRPQHLVIRGICDDASSAKDDRWHAYAAAAAARFARHFLMEDPLRRNTPVQRSGSRNS